MFDTFKRLPEMLQGIICTFCGAVLLLYALGFIEKGIDILVIICAIYLIFVGCMKIGLCKKVMKAIEKK